MMRFFLFLGVAVLSVLGAPADDLDKGKKGQIWAVLVAGSNTYSNYRHQADICHAYQVFHRHGIPDTNIIVMIYDDIANNEKNPRKGVIINKPGGPDVYKGVTKDYVGIDVTPSNFVHVLTGNSQALEGVGSGKVLKSGPNDHVFVNFVDHGSTGLIGFPSSVMYADQLIDALKVMHKNKMYKKLVFYLEACESGSMFANILPEDIEIFAITAATPTQSSYACYWDDNLQAYLGDEYSVAWMEDIDSEEHHKNLTTETLLKQYDNVMKRVKNSHPMMYGEKNLKKDHVKDYVGRSKNGASFTSEYETIMDPFMDAVSSRDVSLHTLTKEIQLAKSNEEKMLLEQELNELMKGRKMVDDLFDQILNHVNGLSPRDLNKVRRHPMSLSLGMMPCYRTLVDNFSQNCVNINNNTYTMKHLYKFANLCVMDDSSAEDVQKIILAVCSGSHKALQRVN